MLTYDNANRICRMLREDDERELFDEVCVRVGIYDRDLQNELWDVAATDTPLFD